MRLSAAARTTISSLKPQRSSRLPPPRATMRRSGRGTGPPGLSALKPRIAAATSGAQRSPCTVTGQSSTGRGKRSRRRCRMSRITAPDGEVITPITAGQVGQRPLAGGVEQALGRERLLAHLEHRHQRADPGRRDLLDDELVLRRGREGGEPAGGDDLHPLLRRHGEPARRHPPDHRAEAGAIVFEVQIDVAGSGPRDAADLAAHPHPAELALEHALHRPGDLGYAELRRVLSGPRFVEQLHHASLLPVAGTIGQPAPLRHPRRPSVWPIPPTRRERDRRRRGCARAPNRRKRGTASRRFVGRSARARRPRGIGHHRRLAIRARLPGGRGIRACQGAVSVLVKRHAAPISGRRGAGRWRGRSAFA